MEIEIRATEFEPGERLKGYAERKLAKLQRYLVEAERIVVELSEEPTRAVETRHTARVNLIAHGRIVLRAEAKAADAYVANDAVVNNLKVQLLRYKERRDDWRHGQPRREEPLPPVSPEEEEAETEETL